MSDRSQQSLTRIRMAGLWMYVLVDTMVAAMMCWCLYRKRTGFARTDSMIMTLMAYTIKSGFLLSALGAGVTIGYLVAISTQLYVAFYLVMSRCFMNTLYAMLNTRDYVRDRTTTNNPDSATHTICLQSDLTHRVRLWL